MKRCCTCKLEKDLSDFSKNKSTKDGYEACCKPCKKIFQKQYENKNSKIIKEKRKIEYHKNKDRYKEQYKKWRLNNVDKDRSRKLLWNFGITLDSYNQMLKEQDNKCSICKKDASSFKRFLAVDHCHISGQIRGLLCDKCNKGIGLFNDNSELLQNAIIYIDYHKSRKNS